MNESNLIGHCTDLNSPYKFVQNFWVDEENGITEDIARQKLREFFPTLKRWKR